MSKVIKVILNGEIVGLIQSLAIDPNTDKCLINTSRARFDRVKIAPAFSKGFFHMAAQKVPFQIEIDNDESVISIQNVWITDLPYTYNTDDYVIVESMRLEAESAFEQKK